MGAEDIVTAGFSRRQIVKGSLMGAGAVALAPILGSCSADGTTPPDSPSGDATAPAATIGPPAAGPLYPDGYVGPRATDDKPFADGSATFKIVVPQNSTLIGDWNTNKFSAWFEKRTGLKIEYQAVQTLGVDGAQDLTKVNAMIASGDLPDAFLGIPFTDAQISVYGQQGLLVPIDSYLPKYAPRLTQAFKDYPTLPARLKSLDNKSYQFKALSDCYHCKISPGRAWINTKYLDKVGASMPTTTEELRTVLKQFKDSDPSGTGKMIPFAAGIGNDLDRFIMNAFLYNPGVDWMRVDSGKIDFVANKPEWREGLRFLRTLSDDGTVNRQTFTMTAEDLLKAGNQGRVGFGRTYHPGQIADLTDDPKALWHDYVGVPPLKGPGGVQLAGWDYNLLCGPPMLITNKCKQPEALVQWADCMLELTAQLNSSIGVQSENWDWAKKGEPGLNGEQAVWKSKVYPAPAGDSWALAEIYYSSSGLRGGQYEDPKSPGLELVLFDATKLYEPHAQPEADQVPKLIFDDTTAAQQADTQVTITNHVNQSLAKFATGELDINDDAKWDAYTKALTDIGLPGQIDLYQKTYDSRPH